MSFKSSILYSVLIESYRDLFSYILLSVKQDRSRKYRIRCHLPLIEKSAENSVQALNIQVLKFSVYILNAKRKKKNGSDLQIDN